jgi:bacillithiol system protein YtxJ
MPDYGFFGANTDTPEPEFWMPITNEFELENALKESFEKPIAVFKHSERCSISRFAKRRLNREINALKTNNFNFYIIDVVNFRPISLLLAEKVNVRHESPQLLIIEQGICLKNASHENVNWPLDL